MIRSGGRRGHCGAGGAGGTHEATVTESQTTGELGTSVAFRTATTLRPFADVSSNPTNNLEGQAEPSQCVASPQLHGLARDHGEEAAEPESKLPSTWVPSPHPCFCDATRGTPGESPLRLGLSPAVSWTTSKGLSSSSIVCVYGAPQGAGSAREGDKLAGREGPWLSPPPFL